MIDPEAKENEKIMFLKSHLAPEIAVLFDACPKYDEIWKRLDFEYGNRDKIMQEILSEFQNAKPCHDEFPAQTINFITLVELAVKDLEYLEMQQELNFALLITVGKEVHREDDNRVEQDSGNK